VNWFNVALAAIVLGSIVIGFRRGFVRSAVGMVASIVAVICALWFYAPLGFWLHGYIRSRLAADATGFAVVFAGIMILGAVAECFLVRIVRAAHLRWPDRFAGATFGVVQGLLWATVVVLVILAFAPRPLPKAVVTSRFVPYFADAGHLLASAAPEPVREGYWRARRDLEKVLPDPVQKRLEKISF
jgi:membrane protein required for colicin V production